MRRCRENGDEYAWSQSLNVELTFMAFGEYLAEERARGDGGLEGAVDSEGDEESEEEDEVLWEKVIE